MNTKLHRRSGAVLNLTPLIDIVFLLLVFFLLTAHFVEDEAISIDLPEASSSALTNDDEYVEVIITSDGNLLVDGKTLATDVLESKLRGALHAPGKRFVRLRGDTESRFGLAVHVIDAARSAGAESLDILTEKP